MADRIEVGYKLVGGNNLGIYHKYILYTKDIGLPTEQKLYARGGFDSSITSEFGAIDTESGEYMEGTKDWDANGTHPRETIIEGDDLSSYWQSIKDVMTDIDNRNITYDPTDTNSNASVDEALRRSGLPTPAKDGPLYNWSPGSDFDLPGGDVAPGGKSFGEELGEWLQHELGLDDLSDGISDFFTAARNWMQPRRDPLVLDLDGDGIETLAASVGVLFDHNGDGIKTGGGWVKGDDAFLVRDLNGNGSIDNGAELLGVDTVLSNGQLASDGFSALRDLDSNADNVFNASDTQFSAVRLWRDLNQDGISQAGELSTLAQANIVSIDLNATTTNLILTGNNRQTAQSRFTKIDGSTGTVQTMRKAA